MQVLSEEDAKLKVEISTGQNAGFQFTSHPNIDKKLYTSENVLRLKDPQKPFPAGSRLGILKWRMQVLCSEPLHSVAHFMCAECYWVSVAKTRMQLCNEHIWIGVSLGAIRT